MAQKEWQLLGGSRITHSPPGELSGFQGKHQLRWQHTCKLVSCQWRVFGRYVWTWKLLVELWQFGRLWLMYVAHNYLLCLSAESIHKGSFPGPVPAGVKWECGVCFLLHCVRCGPVTCFGQWSVSSSDPHHAWREVSGASHGLPCMWVGHGLGCSFLLVSGKKETWNWAIIRLQLTWNTGEKNSCCCKPHSS